MVSIQAVLYALPASPKKVLEIYGSFVKTKFWYGWHKMQVFLADGRHESQCRRRRLRKGKTFCYGGSRCHGKQKTLLCSCWVSCGPAYWNVRLPENQLLRDIGQLFFCHHLFCVSLLYTTSMIFHVTMEKLLWIFLLIGWFSSTLPSTSPLPPRPQ